MTDKKQPILLYTLIILIAIISVLTLLMAGAMLTLHISLSAILEALEWSSTPAARSAPDVLLRISSIVHAADRTTLRSSQFNIDPETLAHGKPVS